MFISGNKTLNTMPPAKIPTAIFDTMNVMIDTIDSTYRELTENRFSKNSGMVKTIDRA